ncbi:MAG: hypothetical protein A2854_04315 [Parcubacteria group bacterium RIFCSPHIGHO2_01_FULL_56_18]|nr:MAG: hypothetical protein A2854_04315 [Parcubacteria group bacterium RIFCSPHIGHO2_01_FULL_56_18]
MSLQEDFSKERGWRKTPDTIAYGSDVERALFGNASLARGEKDAGYMPFEQALEFAKKHQPNLLARSRTVKDLRMKVAALCSDTTVPVKFFTAVGTPLDTFHGVDAFFEQGGRIATIDVSLREKEAVKADVLLLASFGKEGEAVVSEEEVLSAARKIAERLNARHLSRAA